MKAAAVGPRDGCCCAPALFMVEAPGRPPPSRHPPGSCLARAISLGFPASDCGGTPGALEARAGCAAAGWSSFSSPHFPTLMPNKQPSFAERCRAMFANVDCFHRV